MVAEDILFQAFKAYELLNRRAFVVTLSTGYAFILSFKSENFKHLVGIQHLKDIEPSRFSAGQIYRLVRSHVLTEATLRKSSFFEDSSMRILDFQRLPEIFRENALVIPAFNSARTGAKIRGDILIYEEDQYRIFLTLSCCRECVVLADGVKRDSYVPESFMSESTDRLIRGQQRARITALREIPKESVRPVKNAGSRPMNK